MEHRPQVARTDGYHEGVVGDGPVAIRRIVPGDDRVLTQAALENVRSALGLKENVIIGS